MKGFSYTRTADLDTAIREGGSHRGSRYIAGGTNLLDLMKENVERPDRLVDVNHLPLRNVEALEQGGVRIGALATNAEVAYHEQVRRQYPVLSRAILAGASPQIRNMATTGGNLLQRTRCVYFYDMTTPCNKREPGSGCSALEGYNKYLAILGASEHCIATHPSDMAVGLAVLDATVQVAGPRGPRSLPLEELHRLPGDTPERDTNLEQGEVITSVELPQEGFARHHTYLKIRERTSFAFALVSVAAVLELDGEVIREARLALGGVAHKPWRDRQAESELRGRPARNETYRGVAEAMLRGARGCGQNDFKIELAKRAIVRALQQAAQHTDYEYFQNVPFQAT